MRITEKEKTAIVDAVHIYDPAALIYLFGSRVNNSRKGGDIDLLVVSDLITFSNKIDILVGIKDKIGDQKIDLLIKNHQEFKVDPFVLKIIDSALRLS